ncbi:hypothetical protein TREMEDRAFT_33358 [Tremella mesenterica DSM 1558]|uniref:uncharacterized protein n=1 Tax=Tremella mesenterica (strain ATCC 24925 / CBS 8224 / DSM 1558 / NBRC 9311 / NRRL Y-6157 / RJB 2259-6 / UBC 559-6) TaxID=578456 RepID=UPI0003F49004|nr:uncharacterized protein TREMEDRAFT_33358 [Tremella mesenterica DSM 1558]EIW67737.1 hypothetical protein TREMEDRAFT_33358 [Tremella mesenterica DSM 1558]
MGSVEQGKAGAEYVNLPGDGGSLILRKVPDDNSCLFSAIGVVFEGGIEGGKRLRQVIANAIREDPNEYPDVVLGMSRDQYIAKILQPDTWGGAIELSIFSKHYKTEISSFDVATGRCDRFGQDQYDTRCFLVYSGIHYDALSLSPTTDAPPEFHTTLFQISDSNIFSSAEKLVSQLRSKHYYTDTATFDLRCGVCGIGLRGEKGAREHALSTGRESFYCFSESLLRHTLQMCHACLKVLVFGSVLFQIFFIISNAHLSRSTSLP